MSEELEVAELDGLSFKRKGKVLTVCFRATYEKDDGTPFIRGYVAYDELGTLLKDFRPTSREWQKMTDRAFELVEKKEACA